MLAEGTIAPDFTAPDYHGVPITLSTFRGKWVLLWWYPKALTPGCTSCGQQFQRHISEFADFNCQILGISFDAPEKNLEFAQKHRFVYPLLSADFDLGRTYETKRPDGQDWADLPLRISYLIDPEGTIVKAYKVLDPSQHVEKVLADLQQIQDGAQTVKRRWWKRTA